MCQATGGGQFRRRVDQPLDDHSHDQISFAAALRRIRRPARVGAASPGSLPRGRGEGFCVASRSCGETRLSSRSTRRKASILGRPVGEVGQGALHGFLALAPTFAEEDGGAGVAVGDGFDVHGGNKSHIYRVVKRNMNTYMGALYFANPRPTRRFSRAYPRITPLLLVTSIRAPPLVGG